MITAGSCVDNYTITRTWIATDSCGNSASCVQTIMVQDTTRPVIMCAIDTTINCGTDTSAIALGMATALDDCSDMVTNIYYTDSIASGNCNNNYTILRTWIATDSCGNSSTCLQSIMVQDTIAPDFILPGNVDTVECGQIIVLVIPGDATDNCQTGFIPIMSDFYVIDSICPGEYKLVLSFTASDSCNNSTFKSDTIVFLDRLDPEIMCPFGEPIEIDCGEAFPAPYADINEFINAGGQVFDMCCIDSLSFALIDEIPEMIDGQNRLTRMYEISDCCGHRDTCTEVYFVPSCFVDLALKKQIDGATPYYASMGGTVPFKVTIYNQFMTAADSIKIIDYLPSVGSSITTAGWMNNGDGTACLTLSVENGLLPAGGLQMDDSVEVYFTVQLGFDMISGMGVNIAEIASAKDIFGNDVLDLDSNPNSVSGDDEGGQPNTPADDAIDGDGTGANGPDDATTDEDDSDPAAFFICSDLVCNSEINFSLDSTCMAVLDASVLNVLYEGGLYTLTLLDENGNIIPDNKITTEHIGQKIKASVTANTECGGNTCWGYINIEDKLPPIITAPMDTVVFCLESTEPERTGFATAEDCSPVTITHHDIAIDEDYVCNSDGDTIRVITRVWSAFDEIGNIVRDTQYIAVVNLPDSLLRSPQAQVTLACGESTTPEAIAALKGVSYGYAYYLHPVTMVETPLLVGGICNFAVVHEDGPKVYIYGPECPSSYKFTRTWTVLNWCTGRVRKTIQIIKVIDTIAPTIVIDQPLKEYSVDAWKCETDVLMPSAKVMDNCDEHAKVVKIEGPLGIEVTNTSGKWIARGVKKGLNTFHYIASDCAGNLASDSIVIKVVDKVAPVAVTKEYIVVSLTRSGVEGGEEPGIAKVTTSMIDNGSYDNCSGVKLELRREAGDPSCLNVGLNDYNNNLTYDNTGHKEDHPYDTDGGEFVKFCCEDIGKELKIWLRVWDDADMDGVYGSAGDNFNEAWATVKVEDKSTPTITCEHDITLSCDEAGLRLSLDKWTDVAGNVPSEYWPWVDGVCANYSLEYRDQGKVTACNTTLRGEYLTRTYRIKGTNVTCTNRVYINETLNDPKLDWPIALHTWTKCTLTEEDVLNNTVKAAGSSNIKVVSASTETAQAIEYYSYIPYNWYPWVGGNHNSENLGQYCLNSASNVIASSGTNGRTPFDGGLSSDLQNQVRFDPNWREIGCKVMGRKIIIDEYEVGEACKKWIVRFEYFDWCNPQWAACVSTIYKFDDTIAPTINVAMTDTVSVDVNCYAKWISMPEGIDSGGCDQGLKWTVDILLSDKTLTMTAFGSKPAIEFNNIPAGVWMVHYKLTDGCGNVATKDAKLVVVGKAPTPYCVSLSSAVMKNGVVELWAKDFDLAGSSNCNGGALYYTFDEAHPVLTKLDKYHYFMGKGIEVTGADTLTLYLQGIAQKWIPASKSSGKLFGCAVGDGSSFPASKFRMSIWDQYLNTNYCEVTLSLVDNQNACDTTSNLTIGGTIAIESGNKVPGIEVTLDAKLPEYPRKTQTDQAGAYQFEQLPSGFDYTVTPKLNANARNGVNTLDLVHIQRHILALKKLSSPYKMIAADANKDGAIRVEDLVALRKLILGVYDELPESESWVFVDGNQEMTDKPWPFNEMVAHTSLSENKADNFVAVKVGDVDGSAKTNIRETEIVRPRDKGLSLYFDEQMVKAGDIVTVPLKVTDFTEVYGLQLELSFNGLEIDEIEENGVQFGKDNYAIFNGNTVTMSWSSQKGVSLTDDQQLITVKARATRAGKLSQMMSQSYNRLQSEAYVGSNIETIGINMMVRDAQAGKFALYQNEPNPWRGETNIYFELPKEDKVKLSIMTLTGQQMASYNIDGKKGSNVFRLSKADAGLGTGIFIYTIESNGLIDQRKMIIID
ncbi:MAG: T9SS type A sorting domain-containing protein [Saprospiraceae bacterium]|nr:T9SS type A sorting domain-containing protein [Saprospiraceae bacterium]